MSEVIEITGERVTLYADTPEGVGSKIDLEVKLPEGILLTSFTVNGTITACEYVRHNGASNYMIQMRIGDLSPMNKKILEAYVDFLEGEKMLKAIKVSLNATNQAFNEAFRVFRKELRQLGATAEKATSDMRGALELMRRNAEGKTTIH